MALMPLLDPWRALVDPVALQSLPVRDLLPILPIHTNHPLQEFLLNRFLCNPCLGGLITYVFPLQNLANTLFPETACH